MTPLSNISTITLGTVQLGLPYGIANKSGLPSTEYSHRLLRLALQSGIQSLDTARIYGKAEEVIGSFPEAERFTIVSKFKLSDASLENLPQATHEAISSLKLSVRHLKRAPIPICLFHKDKDQDMGKVARVLPGVLKALKEEGLILEGGISVYAPGELACLPDWEGISAVQVPMNILDTRLLQDNLMTTLLQRGVRVFIRSIYLQGLLLLEEREVPPQLTFIKSYRQQLNTLAQHSGRSLSELAFCFVRDTPGVTSLVVGAESMELLQDNIRLLQSPPLSGELYEQIKETFKHIPEAHITPALWNA